MTSTGWHRGWARIRARACAGVLAALATLVSCSGTESAHAQLAATTVDAYFEAVAGGTADRGWDLLAPDTRAVAFASEEAYTELAAEADWSGFGWQTTEAVMDDPTLALVTVATDPTRIPDFLLRRGVWSVLALDREAKRGYVWVTFRFGEPRIFLAGG